jgi:DNA-binding transcriptional ArsR family regulator
MKVTRFPGNGLDIILYFRNARNIENGGELDLMAKAKNEPDVARYADMFSAMGTEPRLRIMRALLASHPEGMIAGDIGAELDIPASTLSHHLDKLKNEDLVKVRRDSTFLWYSANTEGLQELLGFLYAECCTRNKAIEPRAIVRLCS